MLEGDKKRKFENNENNENEKKQLKFRNYIPKDHNLLKQLKIIETKTEVSNDNIIKKELRKYSKDELNIIPRSANWDIKKLLEPKIEKLKRKTQKAIVDLLREKLANMSDSEDGSDNENEKES